MDVIEQTKRQKKAEMVEKKLVSIVQDERLKYRSKAPDLTTIQNCFYVELVLHNSLNVCVCVNVCMCVLRGDRLSLGIANVSGLYLRERVYCVLLSDSIFFEINIGITLI